MVATIRFYNLREGEQVTSPCLIIRGEVVDCGGVQAPFVNVHHPQLPSLKFAVNNNGFRATVLLTPGMNRLTFALNDQIRETVTCQYTPLLQNQPIHLCLLVAKDSPLKYDCPSSQLAKEGGNGLDLAIKKLRVGARLMQAYTNEQLRRAGYGHRTFPFVEEYAKDTQFRANEAMRNTIKIHILHSDKTVAEIRDHNVAQQNPAATNSGGLFQYAMEALHQYGGPFVHSEKPVQAAVMILDAHWDGKFITGHAALGGGNDLIKLAIFGSHGLYSWPTCMEDIESYFLDDTKANIKEVANDNGECGTHWECLTITLGAFMHEIGHLLGCPHQEYGVMLRDYTRLNRSFLTKEAFSIRTGSTGAEPPIKPEEECRWHPLDLVRFLYHPSFTLPEDYDDETFMRPSKIGGFTVPGPSIYPMGDNTCRISSKTGVYSLEIFCGDLARGYIKYIPKSLGGPGPQQEIVLTKDDLLGKLPLNFAAKYGENFGLKVLVANGPEAHIDNFSALLNIERIPMDQYGLSKGIFGIKSQLYGSSGAGMDPGILAFEPKSVAKVRIYYGGALDGIKFTLTNGKTLLWGYEKSTFEEMILEPDEYIFKFNVRSGQWMDALQIVTNKGRTSKMVGNVAGGGLRELMPPSSQFIIGLYGRVGQWMDALGIIYGPVDK